MIFHHPLYVQRLNAFFQLLGLANFSPLLGGRTELMPMPSLVSSLGSAKISLSQRIEINHWPDAASLIVIDEGEIPLGRCLDHRVGNASLRLAMNISPFLRLNAPKTSFSLLKSKDRMKQLNYDRQKPKPKTNDSDLYRLRRKWGKE